MNKVAEQTLCMTSYAAEAALDSSGNSGKVFLWGGAIACGDLVGHAFSMLTPEAARKAHELLDVVGQCGLEVAGLGAGLGAVGFLGGALLGGLSDRLRGVYKSAQDLY